MEAKVYRARCEESSIPKGGLEIVTLVTFKICDEKKRYLSRLVEWVQKNYKSPDTAFKNVDLGEQSTTNSYNSHDGDDEIDDENADN